MLGNMIQVRHPIRGCNIIVCEIDRIRHQFTIPWGYSYIKLDISASSYQKICFHNIRLHRQWIGKFHPYQTLARVLCSVVNRMLSLFAFRSIKILIVKQYRYIIWFIIEYNLMRLFYGFYENVIHRFLTAVAYTQHWSVQIFLKTLTVLVYI